MTLNAIIALILRFFTEFHRFSGRLYHSGWRQTYNVCKILTSSSSLLLLSKTITHPAARSLCDSWASCFFGSSFSLQPRPLHHFHDQYVKWRGFAQGGAFWGSQKIIHFNPIFPQKRKFFANFIGDRKFRVKKALTMGMLTCKLCLIVIVAQ